MGNTTSLISSIVLNIDRSWSSICSWYLCLCPCIYSSKSHVFVRFRGKPKIRNWYWCWLFLQFASPSDDSLATTDVIMHGSCPASPYPVKHYRGFMLPFTREFGFCALPSLSTWLARWWTWIRRLWFGWSSLARRLLRLSCPWGTYKKVKLKCCGI